MLLHKLQRATVDFAAGHFVVMPRLAALGWAVPASIRGDRQL
jgi:hypothetical protein